MPCCKCEEHKWEPPQEVVYTDPEDGKEYCLFHAPAEHKGVSVDDFNAQVFERIQETIDLQDEIAVCNLAGTIFPGDVVFSKSLSLPGISFRKVRFEGHACFNKIIFNGFTDFTGAVFTGITDFGEASFKGSTYFSYAIYEDVVSYESALFESEPNFNKVTFKRGVYFNIKDRGTKLTTFKGGADFREASFGGDASFESVCFKQLANFYSAKFRGEALFNSANFGGAYFTASSFGRGVYFCDSSFERFADFSDSSFKGDLEFSDSFFGKGVEFNSSRFEGSVIFWRIRFSENVTITFRECTVSHASITLDECDPTCFDFTQQYDLTPFRFINSPWDKNGRIKACTDDEPDELQPTRDFYQRMKAKYKAENNEYEASKWHIAEKEAQLKLLCPPVWPCLSRIKRGLYGLVDKPWSKAIFNWLSRFLNGVSRWFLFIALWLYKIVSGFGEKPGRAFAVLLLVLFLPLLILTWLEVQQHFAWWAFDSVKVHRVIEEWLTYIPLTRVVDNKAELGGWHALRLFWQFLITIQAALFAFALRNKFRR